MEMLTEKLEEFEEKYSRKKSNLSKIAPITIPKFNSKLKKWTKLNDTFSSIIDKSSLSNIEKFQHLKNSLEGDAASESNLTSIYGRKQLSNSL
jgi:Protein of unknown function (DUF1759)